MQSNTVTLNGNVVVTRGKDVVRGQRLVVDLNTGCLASMVAAWMRCSDPRRRTR